MPNEDFIYLGDTGRFSLWARPLEEIRALRSRSGVSRAPGRENGRGGLQLGHLRGARRLQAELQVPVVGVIAPEAEAAVQATRNRRIGLLATQATSRPVATRHLCARRCRGSVLSHRLPGPGELIESDTPYGAGTVDAVRSYARPLKQDSVDTVILGCTHYPLIRHVLERAFAAT